MAQIAKSVSGLRASATKEASAKKQELANNPPSMERPTGAPITKAQAQNIPDAAALPNRPDPKSVEKVPEGADLETPEPAPVPDGPKPAIDRVGRPAVTETEDGKVSPDAAQAMRSQLANLPTEDPSLRMQAGPAPKVKLDGNADPAKMVEQHGEFREKVTEARAKGAAEAAQPMGENKLFPDVQPETLTAEVGGGGGAGAAAGGGGSGGGAAGAGGVAAGGGAAGAAAGGDASDAVGIIAEEKKGDAVRSAVSSAKTQASDAQSQHATELIQAQTEHAKAVAAAEEKSADEQKRAREQARGDVAAARGSWTSAQQSELSESDEKASAKVSEQAEEIAAKKSEADSKAQDEIQSGNEKAEAERQKAAQQAQHEKAKGQRESGGIFGWVASKAKSFFDSIKQAISAVLEAARKAIKEAIELAKKAAVAVIEAARKAAVALVKAAGDFLIELGGALLANFPALREKWENAIKGFVAAAEDAINKAAEALKNAAVALLDAYAAAWDAALGLLEKGLNAAVDFVAKQVDGAIKFAKGIADKLGAFVQLVGDVADDPIGWISNLGAAVVDGIKNHLWSAFKSAVNQWFQAKVQGLLSVGATVWKLVTGELGFSEIAKMAWGAIQAMIPPTLVRILIEKLVAMIVPAAGALMVIIEGLQAAWGTISQIIQALETFIAFLKAVKGGGAGPKFAAALAQAAIVVLDFVANFLLLKLGKGLKALAGKLKGIARRLMKKKRAMKSKRGKASGRARRRKTTGPRRRKRPTAAAKRRRKKDPNQKRQDKKQRDRRRARQIVDRVAAALGKPVSAETPEEAVKKKRSKANTLKARFRGRTPRGMRLVVRLDESVAGVRQDKDVDFTVSVNPSKRSSAKVTGLKTLLERFASNLAPAHPAAKPDIKKSVSKVEKSGRTIKSFGQLKGVIRRTPPLSAVYQSPLSSAKAFGKAMSGLLRAAITTAKAKRGVNEPARSGEVNVVRGKVSAGASSAAAQAKSLLQSTVFKAGGQGRVAKKLQDVALQFLQGGELAQRPTGVREGREVEREIQEKLGVKPGESEKSAFSDVQTRKTTKPDLPVGDRFGVTDIKDVRKLSQSAQTRAQGAGASTLGTSQNLIVTDKTEEISGPLRESIFESGGQIFRFDKETKTFSTLTDADFNGPRIKR